MENICDAIGVCGETFRTHEIPELLPIDSFRPGHAPTLITALSGNYKILGGFTLHNMEVQDTGMIYGRAHLDVPP